MSISGSSSISSSRSLKVIRNSGIGSIRPDNKAPEWNLNQIYGRENESKIIQDHIDKLSTGTIVVKGLSGSGKSSLIESQKFEEDGWVYAKGKYEGRRKQEPYSALIEALDSLVDQWMINNNNADVCKMPSFSVLMEEDLVFLGNILPKAFHDIKAQKLKSEKCALASSGIRSEAKSEAQVGPGAINAAFWRIVSFFCETKPVVLFLDDIQWADQASLDAIQALSSAGNIEGFLLILSYREEEVKEGDSVLKCLDFIKEEGERVETIHVTDLDVENTNKIVSCLFGQESERTLELTKVIHSKTAGNPFFVVQFIQMLRHECFLKYNFLTLEWEWGNVNKMDQLAYVSDNVADVIAASMSKLPHDCLLALQNASCLGKVIPMQVLAEYLRKFVTKEDNICDTLKGIQVKGLKEVFHDAVKFGILTQLDGETFMWAHDKLQYVAYSMIPPRCLQMCHKSLGMVLWEMHKSNPENEWMLYMAADQLNHLTDVTDDGLSEDIARLSFQAGQLSILKSAFFPGENNEFEERF
jgi:predicted ATPase